MNYAILWSRAYFSVVLTQICIIFILGMCVCQVTSVVSDYLWLHELPQASLPMGFSGQDYWIGLPLPTPEDLPWPRDWTHISCVSCIGRWVLYQLSHQGKPKMLSIVPREGAWWGHPWCSGVYTASVRSTAKQTWNIVFHFSPFSLIVKILFGFLLASGYSLM